MLVEQELCRKLVDIFKDALPGVDVEGNLLPSEDGGFKGTPDTEGSVLHIRVGMRGYTSFTDKVAEIGVELEGSIRVEADTDGSCTFICCGKLLSVLSGWQDDIGQVKHDLAVKSEECKVNSDDSSLSTLNSKLLFDPVGFRMDPNGDLDIENDTLTRKYNQSFTLKGRISK